MFDPLTAGGCGGITEEETMTDTTIHDLVAEYVLKAGAIVERGNEPRVPDLMEQVLAAHPEIAIDLESFARMCSKAIRREAERNYEEAEELERYYESRK
jgi:hypothetical protein